MYARKQSKWVKIRKTYGHSVQVDMYDKWTILEIYIRVNHFAKTVAAEQIIYWGGGATLHETKLETFLLHLLGAISS